MLYVLQAVFNRFLKTSGSCDFREVKAKKAGAQASDCDKHTAELLDFFSNNGMGVKKY